MLHARLNTADIVNNKLLAMEEKKKKSIILKPSFRWKIKVFLTEPFVICTFTPRDSLVAEW